MLAQHLHSCFDAAHTSFLRLNCYPPCADPAPADAASIPEHGHLGISRHTDSGALTVLLQDMQPGLQVLHDDRWHLGPSHGANSAPRAQRSPGIHSFRSATRGSFGYIHSSPMTCCTRSSSGMLSMPMSLSAC